MTEAQAQSNIFKWANAMATYYPELMLLNASLNGIRTEPRTKRMMYSQGMKKGYPDMFLPVARHGMHGLFIELKRDGKCKPTPEQVDWIKKLLEQGYEACVCFGEQDAMETIKSYLGIT